MDKLTQVMIVVNSFVIVLFVFCLLLVVTEPVPLKSPQIVYTPWDYGENHAEQIQKEVEANRMEIMEALWFFGGSRIRDPFRNMLKEPEHRSPSIVDPEHLLEMERERNRVYETRLSR